jgi:hypothetical protein
MTKQLKNMQKKANIKYIEWCAKNKNHLILYKKLYYQKNKEVIKARTIENAQKNPQAIKKYAQLYYQKNKEVIKARIKKNSKHRRELLAEYGREYYKKNKKECIRKGQEYYKKRYHNDEKFNIQMRIRKRLRKAFHSYSKNGKTRTSDEYGINYNAICKQLGPKPDNIETWHIDHIKPLCSFDFNNAAQVKQAFSPENHQWLTIKENLSKGSKIL